MLSPAVSEPAYLPLGLGRGSYSTSSVGSNSDALMTVTYFAGTASPGTPFYQLPVNQSFFSFNGRRMKICLCMSMTNCAFIRLADSPCACFSFFSDLCGGREGNGNIFHG